MEKTNKRHATRNFILSVVVIILIIVVAVVYVMNIAGPGGTTLQTPAPTPVQVPIAPPTIRPAVSLASPACTIAISGVKEPPSTIKLQVMSSTCYSGDIAELSVSINGEKKGTLGTGPGATGTFPGTSAANTVIVVAKYSNGAENVVYQNSAL